MRKLPSGREASRTVGVEEKGVSSSISSSESPGFKKRFSEAFHPGLVVSRGRA